MKNWFEYIVLFVIMLIVAAISVYATVKVCDYRHADELKAMQAKYDHDTDSLETRIINAHKDAEEELHFREHLAKKYDQYEEGYKEGYKDAKEEYADDDELERQGLLEEECERRTLAW